jgi:hypothetical protein
MAANFAKLPELRQTLNEIAARRFGATLKKAADAARTHR